MPSFAVEVSDEEKIVRAIKSPYHVKSGGSRLKPAAFRSVKGKDEVSVMRHAIMGTAGCHQKAKEICKGDYVGIAVILAKEIRAAGACVTDSRVEFYGHAHITLGFIVPKDEPLAPEQNMQLDARLSALVQAATFHRDPNPQTANWTGPDF